MTVLQRIIMFICGVCFTWLMLTGFLWILGEGTYWAVRNGSGAGALVIIGSTIAGIMVAFGFLISGYALFGDYDKPEQTEPADDTGRLLTKAEVDVMAERRRQIDEEHFRTADDDNYVNGSLAAAASCYAMAAASKNCLGWEPIGWPWHRSWWKPTTARCDLVKAGALILAEIERLDRLAAPAEESQS